MSVTILQGDVRQVLATLPDESVNMCVTSPPYFGLRSYLKDDSPLKPLEMGLEATPEEFVAGMVEVFREVRRVLRDDGTLWLNIGDSYAGSRAGPQGRSGEMADRTPEPIDLGDGKKPIKGEMWFQVTDQPLFAVAGFWQRTVAGNGFTMVTCDANELVAPIHPKAMITILEPADWDTWLRGTYDDVVALQRPYDAARMTVRGPEFPTRQNASRVM